MYGAMREYGCLIAESKCFKLCKVDLFVDVFERIDNFVEFVDWTAVKNGKFEYRT